MNEQRINKKEQKGTTFDFKQFAGYLEANISVIDPYFSIELQNFLKKRENVVYLSKEISTNDEISHEAQVAFLIKHGIKVEQEETQSSMKLMVNNHICVAFYGVKYLILKSNYKEEQNVFNYFVENNSVRIAS